uniref:AniF2 n=1 Tax=Aspergillus nidulans NRRL 8112 TaxID=1160106 RepID=A0A140G930_EMEND|nr:AniF2 [Aspergillus nidulans NRRL 8112]
MFAPDSVPALLAASVVLALGLASYVIHLNSSRTHRAFWASQPWVGVRDEWFSGARTKLRIITGVREMVEDGFHRFSQSKTAFALPNIGEPSWLVLPPASLHEFLSKPDADLDHNIIHEEQLQHYYTQGPLGHHAATIPLQFDVVRRPLTKQLPLVAGALHDELHRSFQDCWGTDTIAAKQIDLLATCFKIVTRTANRVFAGADICRREAFLEHLRRYSDAVGRAGIIIRLLPRWLRPVVAPAVTVWYRRDLAICREICVPVIRRRVQQTIEKRKDVDCTWEAPVDVLQWLIEAALQRNDAAELDPLLLTQRLLMLNFVSIETTSMAIAHAIADLYGSPDAESFVAGLQEECERVLPHEELWTKAQLDKLVCIDSTIRESMRVSDFSHIQLPRLVANPHGVDFQTIGSPPLHVPPGIRLCVPAHSIHRDASFHPDPLTYNAFRFVIEPGVGAGDAAESAPKRASLATTTGSFLVFGHGRHACPGRFFAAHLMKLMLAYLVRHYDVARLTQPVDKQALVGTAKPDANLRLTVRRRVK